MPETDASRLQGDNDVLRAENAKLRATLDEIAKYTGYSVLEVIAKARIALEE